MGTRGPAPKDADKRQRRNVDPIDPTVLEAEPSPPPKLTRAQRQRMQPETRRWWDMWVRSPQGKHFLESDWERLLMLVPLVDGYWRDPKTATLGEIRLNEERLGATVMDRQRLRYKVESPKAPEPDTSGDARARILKAVGSADE
jgi:hypothetical protein